MSKSSEQQIRPTVLKPSSAWAFIMAAMRAGLAVFNHGKPGIGKSDLYRQIAASLDVKLIDVRAILLDPVDLRGLPTVKDGRAVWAIPSFLPDVKRDGPRGILLLDELNAAPPLVQAACYQLVLDHQLGEYLFYGYNCVEHEHCRNFAEETDGGGWNLVAAGNYESDRAVTHRMPTPLRTRFVHLNMEPDLEDWLKWAARSDIRPEVLAFMRFRPGLLHDFSADTQTFPCPRTWAFASRLIDSEPDASVEHALYAGAVGDGASAELVSFLRVFRSLPDIDTILATPKKASVPRANETAAMYAVAAALARRVDGKNIGNVFEYLERIPAEYAVFCIRDAIRREPELKKTKTFVSWAVKNQELIL